MSEDPATGNRNAAIDLLRLLAALSVVGFHYLYRYPMVYGAPDDVVPVVIAGYLGVNLFFLISGFVIAQSAEGRTAFQFALARFARIYPGFLACMAVTFAALSAAADPRFPATLAQFFANLLVLAPALDQPFMDGVYWSIVIEIVFYAWVALAVFAGIFARRRLELVAAWLALAALNEFWLRHDGLRLAFVTEYAGLFAAGMLLQHIRANGASAPAFLLLVLSFLFSTATMGVMRDWMLEHYGEALGLHHLFAANAAIHALMVAALMFSGRVRSTPAILALGALTYPLYLLHQAVGYVAIGRLEPFLDHPGASAAVALPMMALSLAVWRFVERPLGSQVKALLVQQTPRLPRLFPY